MKIVIFTIATAIAILIAPSDGPYFPWLNLASCIPLVGCVIWHNLYNN